jgi:hypothetical protein
MLALNRRRRCGRRAERELRQSEERFRSVDGTYLGHVGVSIDVSEQQ